MNFSLELLRTLAPTGKLRASINVGNPILAHLGKDGKLYGVSIDLANELGRLLGFEVQFMVFDGAGKSVQAVTAEPVDFGFFAIDPVRGAGIRFTAPYVLIEGAYLVKEDSLLTVNSEVDQAGHRVVVGKGSAYDLYLTRQLQHAVILRSPTSPVVVDTFLESGAEVAAGVKQQLELDAQRVPCLRLLPGRFMVIEQAMGLPKGKGDAAGAVLSPFVESMKASGFIADALARHGIEGASVAAAQP